MPTSRYPHCSEALPFAAPAAFRVHRPFAVVLVSPTEQVGNDSRDTPCQNHHGSAQTMVVAVAVEQVGAAEMLVRLAVDDMMEAVKAVVADVTEAVNTLWTASVQCGIVAGARNPDSLVRALCMVTCC